MSSRKSRKKRNMLLWVAVIEFCLLVMLTQTRIGMPKVDPTVIVVGPYDVRTAIAELHATQTATVCPECVQVTPVPDGVMIITATGYPTETPIPVIPNDDITVW